MAEALLFLKEIYGVEADGETLTVSLSREEIATLVGTATETAIRLLSEFKSGKMVEFVGKKIKIIDQKELLKTANLAE
jgi:CRP/FNR family transcriptional regulator, polysaccharide utilization system transcription regulator